MNEAKGKAECYFCGHVKEKVEPFLPNLPATCPDCFKKAALYYLAFCQAYEELRKKVLGGGGQ